MEKKQRIALLTNHDDDVFCFRLELVQAFLDAGYEMLISCPDGPKFSLMEQRFGLRKDRDFLFDNPTIDRRGTNMLRDLKLFRHYFRLLKRTRPAAILTYTAKPNIYACFAAKLLRIPVIGNITGYGSVLRLRGVKRAVTRILFRGAFRAADAVMFQNEENMRLALKWGFVRKNYRLIPGSGVALHRFPPLEYPEGGDGVTGAPVVFNYMGRILREKGIDEYLEAAKRIREKYPRTEFNLIGFIEPTEAEYQERIDALERGGIVAYRGEQEDVLPWIARSHAVIHPSFYGEGMSNVLLENASCARPLLTTDNAGCRETVDDGVNGFLFPDQDADALTGTIERFLRLPNEARRRMGLKGREKMVAEFDRKIVVRAYLQTVRELCGGEEKKNG